VSGSVTKKKQTNSRRKLASFGDVADQEQRSRTWSWGSSRTGRGKATSWKEPPPRTPATKRGYAEHLRRSKQRSHRNRAPRDRREQAAKTPEDGGVERAATGHETRTPWRFEIAPAATTPRPNTGPKLRSTRKPKGAAFATYLGSRSSHRPLGHGTRRTQRRQQQTRDAPPERRAPYAGAGTGAGTGAARGTTRTGPEKEQERTGQGGGSWTERYRVLTCVEALGYGGGLPQEAPAEWARQARGELLPPHAYDLHLLRPRRDTTASSPGRTRETTGSRRISLGLRSARRAAVHPGALDGGGSGGGGAPARRGGGDGQEEGRASLFCIDPYWWCACINRWVGGDCVWAWPGAPSGAGAPDGGASRIFPYPRCTFYSISIKKNCCERRVVEAEHATRPLPGMEVVSCDGLWKLNTQPIRYR
jgi:hypothetical protein